ncbi:hypothetical protein GCM10027270_06970 [Nocardioides ginkgobilobae]
MEPAISSEPGAWSAVVGTPRNTTDRYDWEYPPVAPSVGDMASYDDLSPLAQMHEDCTRTRATLERHLARAAARPAPSILFADYPREVKKRDIEVGEAAQRIANALSLHLD